MRLIICLSVVSLVGLPALPALAQSKFDTPNIAAGAPKAPDIRHKSVEPPAAVPGARARPDSVAPAERGIADMPPTEALFDAINRGDISSARDALSRGADLDGTNLLGLTPTELSVDLGRNDITFLLLSMRGGGGSGQRGPAPTDTASAAPPPKPERRRAVQVKADAPPPVPATKTGAPALFAGNGGAPVPSAGFLGFDPKH